MGNANGREEGSENGGGGGGGGDVVLDGSNHALSHRVASADLMVSSPPHDPRQSRSPRLFSSQAPVIPLQRSDSPSLNPLRQNESPRAVQQSLEQGIPIIITWSYGGNNVAVEGSWDNWRTRKILQRSGKDHSILLVLPSGIFRYKFIVDGEVRYIPDLPSETDETGGVCNLLDVHDYVPENLDSVAEFEAPPSPESSYSQVFPGDEDFAKDPVLVPPQLQTTVLETDNRKETDSSKPQHVVLNHLFTEKGWSSQSVVALGLTHRFQSKYVTVVLYKPLKR
ncbi:UNVERIFIED_CONTAM: SNF1-related protein kinase regulatory subunit beta-1 [Sesamum radiatum]|uniref:SNF1-related protein kinase regulatory subunit beta-1 n=1 Tax=Sesamum radiatum TaxID=300843 RepID=A0AAW2UQ85_SESRA